MGDVDDPGHQERQARRLLALAHALRAAGIEDPRKECPVDVEAVAGVDAGRN